MIGVANLDAPDEEMRTREVLVHIAGRVAVVSHWDGRRYDDKPYDDKIRSGHERFRRSRWNRLRIAIAVYRQLRDLL